MRIMEIDALRPATSAGARDGRGKTRQRVNDEPAPEREEEEAETWKMVPFPKTTKRMLSSTKAVDTSKYAITRFLATDEAQLCQQLLIAAEKGNQRAVYLILHQSIDRDRCRGMRGFTPLHHAAVRGHLHILQLLLDARWPVDVSNDAEETPLHLACFHGHLAVAEFLLDRHANINAVNEDHETPLFYAARKRHHRIVRLLVRRECDLRIENRYGDRAEDEVVSSSQDSEKTRLELQVGKEDYERLYDRPSTAASSSKEFQLHQQQREWILSFLDVQSLGRASQVAYRWHRAADNPSLWRRLGINSRWELLLQTTCGLGQVPATSFFALSKVSKRPSSCDASSMTTPDRRAPVSRQSNVDKRPQTARQVL